MTADFSLIKGSSRSGEAGCVLLDIPTGGEDYFEEKAKTVITQMEY